LLDLGKETKSQIFDKCYEHIAMTFVRVGGSKMLFPHKGFKD
jgi:hypothetical protein